MKLNRIITHDAVDQYFCHFSMQLQMIFLGKNFHTIQIIIDEKIPAANMLFTVQIKKLHS